jgi:TolB-like protein/tRNA A-37 threonylcarbamoyl transferase component Bud32
MSDGPTERLAAALADRYRLERELGQGGMATVYLAADLKHDRKVAIKVLRPEVAAALGAERFLREITTTANLRHPHILPLYDSGEAGGFLYYVMPYVEGESLRDRLEREKQLPLGDALRIAHEVADALSYAHSRGVIHRDIKPENILLESGHAVVADFGIARALDAAGAASLTETGLAIGTPRYMSPEQAAGEKGLDGRSDLYSLACVLYEMLGGQPPFTGPTVESVVHQHLAVEAPPVTNLRPAVPATVVAALQRALAKHPADRFNPVAQFADVLTAWDHPAAPPGAPSVPAAVGRRRWGWIAASAVLAVLAVVAILTRGGRSPASAVPGAIRSIAVLPLDNYSADSTQDYFAEGMTDELTSDLATISQLRVTSRGSAMQFKGSHRPPTPEIARALDVDALVEGSVTRVGDEVRINAQLIDARADRHIWAQTFERKSGDVLALQAELASAIASAINVQLTPREQSRLFTARSVNPAAHDAYLKGRYFFNRPSDENLEKAIAQFDTAVRMSPTFAPAYSGLSDAYTWAAFNEGFISAADANPLAKETAERAVALDSMSAEARTSLGVFKGWFDYDWDGSERELRQAIALNPNYAFAHDQLGLILAIVGRFDEAIAEGRRAMALDPLSPSILVDAACPYIYSRRTAQAVELDRKAADLDPTFYLPSFQDGQMALYAGDVRKAIAKFGESRALGAPAFVTAYLAYAQAQSGDRAGAMAALGELRRISPGGTVAPYNLALLYLGLGDHARALDYLEQAYVANSQQLVWLKVDQTFDPLRSEPRFVALMKRLNLLQ